MPIVLSGVEETIAMLGRFQPYAARAVQDKVKQATQPLVATARGFAPAKPPLSGWGKQVGLWANKSYNALEVKEGIGFDDTPTKPNRKGFTYSAYIYNKSIAGQIYETAGRKNRNGRPHQSTTKGKYSSYIDTSNRVSKSRNPNAGKQFIDSMGLLYSIPRVKGQKGRRGRKKDGRLIFRAWGQDQGKVLGAVAAAYGDVIKKFNGGKLK